MRVATTFLLLGTCLGFSACAGSSDTFQPKTGFVPDAATAIKIAVAVWTPVYGAQHIAEEKPYHATLQDGVWTVEGSMHPPDSPGGVALARIAQKDGRVLEVIHGQ
jgi:hypothetical protein